jgi:hypothetical protein
VRPAGLNITRLLRLDVVPAPIEFRGTWYAQGRLYSANTGEYVTVCPVRSLIAPRGNTQLDNN